MCAIPLSLAMPFLLFVQVFVLPFTHDVILNFNASSM